MINIPNETKDYSIVNTSDLKGNVFMVKGMNFDDEGYLTLSNATKAVLNENQDSNFDQSAVIVFNGDIGQYVTQTWDDPYTINTDILAEKPVENVDANRPVGASVADATWFGDKLVYTESTDVTYWDSATNTWVDTNISLSNPGFSNQRHAIENFRSLGYLAIADVNVVKLYSAMSATPTLIRSITLPTDQAITSMKYFNQNLYIGTQSPYGEEAFVYVANGTSTAYQSVYKIDATEVFDIEVYKNTVIAFASNGAIYYYTGSGFDVLTALPIFYTDRILGSIRHNVLKSNGDVFYLSFSDNDNEDRRLLNQPEGIWCYEPKVGFYCKYPFSMSTTISDSIPTADVNTTTNEITVANDWATGTEVFYREISSPVIGGLTDETKYYVIRVDATHVKLATNMTNALSGTAIDLTTTGNAAQKLIFFPKTDYGQMFTNNRPFAITTISTQQGNPQYGSDIIWSSELNLRNSETSKGYLGSTSEYVEARGYYITPRVFSQEVVDNYNNLVLKWKPLQNDIDKIIVKYRKIDDVKDSVNLSSTNWSITWTSTATFTSTYTGWSTAEEGDEVEVLMGAGAGLLAHISTISESTGTYTVTLDDSFSDYVTGDIGRAIFRNFKKLITITTSTPENQYGYITINPDETKGKFIQIKVECRGQQVKIEELKIDNKTFLPVRR